MDDLFEAMYVPPELREAVSGRAWMASSSGKRCSIEVIHHEKCCTRQTRRRQRSE